MIFFAMAFGAETAERPEIREDRCGLFAEPLTRDARCVRELVKFREESRETQLVKPCVEPDQRAQRFSRPQYRPSLSMYRMVRTESLGTSVFAVLSRARFKSPRTLPLLRVRAAPRSAIEKDVQGVPKCTYWISLSLIHLRNRFITPSFAKSQWRGPSTTSTPGRVHKSVLPKCRERERERGLAAEHLPDADHLAGGSGGSQERAPMHRRLSWKRRRVRPTDVRALYKSQVRHGLMGTSWRGVRHGWMGTG